MESERKPGWYWVKVDNFKFEPMQWVDTGRLAFFKHNGSPLGTQPRNEDVGERIPAPEEPWCSMPLDVDLPMQKAYFDSIDQHMQRVQTDPRFGRFDNQRLAYRAMVKARPRP